VVANGFDRGDVLATSKAFALATIAGLGDVPGAGAGVLYAVHTAYTSVAPWRAGVLGSVTLVVGTSKSALSGVTIAVGTLSRIVDPSFAGHFCRVTAL